MGSKNMAIDSILECHLMIYPRMTTYSEKDNADAGQSFYDGMDLKKGASDLIEYHLYMYFLFNQNK